MTNDILKNLQQLFKKFPGIGERQAMRFAYFVTVANEEYVEELIKTIELAKKSVKKCTRCFALSENLVSGFCKYCIEGSSDKSTILIVEKDADRERFIQSKSYKGTYFVLGGLAPAIENDARSHIRINELLSLVKNESKNNLKEIIFALSATADGIRTEMLLKLELEKTLGNSPITLSFLGRGLSTGTEIEYSDSDTLKYALSSRTTSLG